MSVQRMPPRGNAGHGCLQTHSGQTHLDCMNAETGDIKMHFVTDVIKKENDFRPLFWPL